MTQYGLQQAQYDNDTLPPKRPRWREIAWKVIVVLVVASWLLPMLRGGY